MDELLTDLRELRDKYIERLFSADHSRRWEMIGSDKHREAETNCARLNETLADLDTLIAKHGEKP